MSTRTPFSVYTCEQGNERDYVDNNSASRHQTQNVITVSAGPTAHMTSSTEDPLKEFMCLVDGQILHRVRDCAEVHHAQQSISCAVEGLLVSQRGI